MQKILDLAAKPWALVGGLAVGVRSEPRFTRDIDLAVKVADDAEAEALILTLCQSGYSVHAVIEQKKVGRLATVRLQPPGKVGIITDLLFASSGLEPLIAVEAEKIDVGSPFPIPVALRAHLIATKVLSRNETHRMKDTMDLVALTSLASDEEIESAKRYLQHITDHGFNRDKDLLCEFQQFLAESHNRRE